MVRHDNRSRDRTASGAVAAGRTDKTDGRQPRTEDRPSTARQPGSARASTQNRGCPALAGMNPGSFGGTASSTRLPRSGGDEPCAIIQTQRPRACPRRRGDEPVTTTERAPAEGTDASEAGRPSAVSPRRRGDRNPRTESSSREPLARPGKTTRAGRDDGQRHDSGINEAQGGQATRSRRRKRRQRADRSPAASAGLRERQPDRRDRLGADQRGAARKSDSAGSDGAKRRTDRRDSGARRAIPRRQLPSRHRQTRSQSECVRGAGVKVASPAKRGRSVATHLDAGEHTPTLSV